MHIASNQTLTTNLLYSECKLLTTKLYALHMDYSKTTQLIGMSYTVVWFGRVHYQKQSPEAFFKKVILENSTKFTGKQLCWRLLSCTSVFLFWRNMVGIDPSIIFRGPLAVK